MLEKVIYKMKKNLKFCPLVLWMMAGSIVLNMQSLSAMDNSGIAPAPDASGILYVNGAVSASGQGGSWTNALKYLSDAMNAARTNTAIKEIHVAKGTYYPTGAQSGTARDASFAILRGGIKLLGGYDAATGERDAENNLTVLSGDIGVLNDSLDNSYHVFVLAAIAAAEDSIVIAGFTIEGGNANSGGTNTYHGLVIKQNNGGGLCLDKIANKTLILDCIIRNNTAKEWGGGMYNTNKSTPVLIHSTISNNAGGVGGGILNDLGSAPQFYQCVISDNVATTNSGGGMFNNSSSPLFVNCIISGNVSKGSNGAGAMRNFKSSPTFINSIVVNNTSVNAGAGLRNNGSAAPRIYNSIFWNNKGNGIVDNIHNDAGGDKPQLAYCYLQGDASSWAWDAGYSGADGGGNIVSTESPFVDADKGDFHLKSGSLAIDAGKSSSVPDGITTDIEGNSRVVGLSVDMGAYENLGMIESAAIVVQPRDTVACGDGDASFAVVALNNNVQYQWQSSADNGASWNDVTNGSDAVLSLSDISTADSGLQYRAIVINGQNRDTSDAATLHVWDPASISLQPVDVAICEGESTDLQIGATGTNISYQWQAAPNGGDWSNISGATGMSLQLPGRKAADSGTQYRVLITGGCKTLISDTSTLTVYALPAITIMADKVNPVPPGTRIRLIVVGADSFQWIDGPGIEGHTTDSVLTIYPKQDAIYKVTGKSNEGCWSAQSYSLQVAGDYTFACNNILSPNGDGKNDTWVIQNIDSYPNNEVMVYDRSGRMVYHKKEYGNQWDGTVKGKYLHEGAYYYVVSIDNGKKVYKGYIRLIGSK